MEHTLKGELHEKDRGGDTRGERDGCCVAGMDRVALLRRGIRSERGDRAVEYLVVGHAP